MNFDIVPVLAGIGVAWDVFRRFAAAYHNHSRLTTVEDMAHEATTMLEELGGKHVENRDCIHSQNKSLNELAMQISNQGARMAPVELALTEAQGKVSILEQRVDLLSAALSKQGETLIDHGRKLTNYALTKGK